MDQKVYGEEHPEVVIDLNNLAALLKERRNFQEAEATIRKALELSEKIHSVENPEHAINLGMLAGLLKVQVRHLSCFRVMHISVYYSWSGLADDFLLSPSLSKQKRYIATF